ncbi:cortical protein marker for cell polarity-domain-containing protein [Clohesyomyces aquaticus]|uniref:Cortical protein marker for cell polarity-domain-containing protein n=1 Tax=Clohesyomyces aquaticus TaxID=1231657 RepID=A0A1Y1YVH0_9PLEO|nr:cortical protein marker for cell polarity-domain-containing protein [Clohesyomyces aquaticus]
MRDVSSSLSSRAGKLALSLLLASSRIVPTATAFNFAPIPSPNLNLGQLGRVAFAGDFDSISLYQFQGQSERAPSGGNGALLSRFPNGVFTTVSDTDGDIKTMCAFQQNGKLQGIVVGGNFTSVGGVQTNGGVALVSPTDGKVTPLTGLNGTVNALFCDAEAGRVYVGGSFTGSNSSNAIVWTTEWTNMPFSGFNGPVNSITKHNGNIIFGGKFNGLGNGNSSTAPRENNTVVVPIGSANVSAQTSSGLPGLTDPRNIICKTGATDGSEQNTWLLADNTPGFWKADFGFGFEPSKLRLYNTKFQGRGTKEWRYTALPNGGIMNFTFVDPTTGEQRFCDARCPLPANNVSAQDFFFVNRVGMNSFRIDISGFYGQGGGLSGIELFQNENFAFAINEFNEPACDGVSSGAKTTATGPWQNTPSGTSNSQYLTAVLEGTPVNASAAQIVFQPEIRQSGKYDVVVYTPGCIGDGTCGVRGRVNISGTLARPSSTAPTSFTTEIFQTNNFDKYDTVVYSGFIDSTSDFKPTITLTPMAGQTGPLTIVAQRIKFELKAAAAGNLNGIFEYNPNKQGVDTDFTTSVIDSAGASLTPKDRAIVSSVVSNGDSLFVAGNFSGNGFNNILTVGKDAKNASALPGDGLNGEVLTMFLNGSTIYMGGNFTNTQDGKSTGLNGVAAFSTSDQKWQSLGAGVNGIVMSIVPFTLNLTANRPETVLGISGFFTKVNGAAGNASFAVNDFAIWVPSRSNWLHNLNIATISIQGALLAFTEVPGSDPLFSGSISSQAVGASGAVALESGSPPSLEPFPIKNIKPQSSSTPSIRKRATSNSQNRTGVVTATFYTQNNMNKTILAGNFAATGTDGSNITSLLIIDGKDSDKVTGFHEEISSDSVFMSLSVLDSILYAGGAISGTVNNNRIGGLLAYDLSTNKYVGSQPPPLRGTNITVNAIAPRPNSKDIFVGGVFNSAGDLSCQGLCIWNIDRNQWVSPGGDLSGWVSSMVWTTNTKLVVAGNLTVGGNKTTIVTYDQSKSTFEEFAGANTLPGPVTAMVVATGDGSEIWASGQANDGAAFLRRFDGKTWHAVTESMFGPGTTINGLQVLSVSKEHGKSDLIKQDEDLLILGRINVTGFGTASGVLFNGTTLQPLLLSSTSGNSPGSLSTVFVEKTNFFKQQGKKLKVIFVVLIALAIALALTFLLIVAGILVESYRKRSKGYTPMQMSYPDRGVNVNRVPPSELFGTLGRNGQSAPAI